MQRVELWKEDKDCTACGACRQSCPKQAIVMKENAYGFMFPQIDEARCIDCRRCEHVCPMKEVTFEKKEPNSVFALRHLDEEIRMNSTSGGAFTALIQATQPDVVFGARLTDDLKVIHVAASTREDISLLRGSKYVQSDTGDTFKQTAKMLRQGKRVLYSGTPCQIAGLKSFIGEAHPNLVTVDLVCEGVQSQAFFDRYIQYMEDRFAGDKVKSVAFRSKRKMGWERSYFELRFMSKRLYSQVCQTKDSAYMNSFLFQGGNRDSCYSCPFARIPRQGDFTIADLWGWRSIVPEWSDNKGISLLLCNTDRAEAFLPQIKKFAEIKRTTLEQAARNNPNLIESARMPPHRSDYLEDMKNCSMSELEKKWLKPRSWIRKHISGILFLLRNRFID